MKLTYIDLLRQILAEIESDEVNSLLDTVESEQITLVIYRIYKSIAATHNLEHLKRFVIPFPEPGTPTFFELPSEVNNISWIKHNNRVIGGPANYTTLYFRPSEVFMRVLAGRDSSAGNVTTVVKDGIPYNIYTDRHPRYFTVLNKTKLLFDSYMSSLDVAGIDVNNLQIYGQLDPVIEIDDNYEFDMPSDIMTYFVNECISYAYTVIKQLPNPKIEQLSQKFEGSLRSDDRITSQLKPVRLTPIAQPEGRND